MTMKELLEGYLVILEAGVERREKQMDRALREIASDAEHGNRLGGIESLVKSAREKEIECDVLKDVIRNVKSILEAE